MNSFLSRGKIKLLIKYTVHRLSRWIRGDGIRSPFVFDIKYPVYKLNRKRFIGEGIHSPFVFDINRNVIKSRISYKEYRDIKKYRRSLAKKRGRIKTEDYGAGSRVFSSDTRRIKDIARFTASSFNTGKLLFRLARYFKPQIIIELGTSLGSGTFCLAKGSEEGRVYSIEACPRQTRIAGTELKKTGIMNFELIEGVFQEKLPELLRRFEKVDLVYFDGDHRKESLLWQFRQCLPKAVPGTVFVVGDIHWSNGMNEAWKIICSDSAISLYFDLFYCGLIFFREGMAEQKYLHGYSD